jgi:hypothetical protein
LCPHTPLKEKLQVIEDHVIIERGIGARNLLSQPVFEEVLNDLGNHFIQSLMGTPPEAKEAREVFYHQHLALQGIVAVLNSWVAQSDALVANDDEDEQE